jgi:hypothetical protein
MVVALLKKPTSYAVSRRYGFDSRGWGRHFYFGVVAEPSIAGDL